MQTEVTIHYLEMTARSEFRPRYSPRTDLAFRQVVPNRGIVNKQWYVDVGGPWHWTDRLVWSDSEWDAYAADPNLQTWVAMAGADEVGYAELQRQPGDQVEIVYFGLLSKYAGQGLGAHFLSCTIDRAWQMNARRVWVHTCTLDHPAALPNYVARGFRQYKTEMHVQQLTNDELRMSNQ